MKNVSLSQGLIALVISFCAMSGGACGSKSSKGQGARVSAATGTPTATATRRTRSTSTEVSPPDVPPPLPAGVDAATDGTTDDEEVGGDDDTGIADASDGDEATATEDETTSSTDTSTSTQGPTVDFTSPAARKLVDLAAYDSFSFVFQWTVSDSEGTGLTSAWTLHDTSDCSGEAVASGTGTSAETWLRRGQASVKVTATDEDGDVTAVCSPEVVRAGLYAVGVNRDGAGDFVLLGEAGGKVYFAGSDPVLGNELWVSDGTAGGTRVVRDINPDGGSAPAGGAVIGNAFYFIANDGTHGRELWKTDGTAAGTALVLDANPGAADGISAVYGAYDNLMFLTGTTTAEGTEPWISDGTASGTHLLANVRSGSASSNPLGYFKFDNAIYFFASTAANTVALLSSTGAAPQTVDTFSAALPGFAVLQNKLYFAAADDNTNTGIEPWRYDGTTTAMLKDLRSGSASSLSGSFQAVAVNGALYFPATVDVGLELYKTDGSSGGTVRVKDVNAGAGSSTPDNLAAVGNKLLFWASDGSNGREPWISDGTDAGTVNLASFAADSASSTPKLATLAGKVYFGVTRSSGDDADVYATDGTANGTVAITKKSERACRLLGAGIGQLLMSCRDSGAGKPLELYKSSGAAANLAKVTSIDDSDTGLTSDLTARAVLGDKLIFAGIAGSGNTPNRLYALAADGTLTTLSSTATSFTSLTVAAGKVFFVATTDAAGAELWVTDGTPAGTMLLADIRPGAASSTPSYLTAFGGKLVLIADDGAHGAEIWASDGTPAGTVLHAETAAGGSDASPHHLVVVGGKLYVSTSTDIREISATAGQAVTSQAGSIPVRCDNGYEGCTAVLDNKLIYTCLVTGSGVEPCRFDPAATGSKTSRIADVNPGAGNSFPASMRILGGRVVFAAEAPASSGREIWATDGTQAGTTLLANIRAGTAGSAPTLLTAAGNYVFFAADDGTKDQTLWLTDGTPGGTRLVKDTSLVAGGGDLSRFFALDGKLYFTSDRTGSGVTELWRSDGTDNGTVLVQSDAALEQTFSIDNRVLAIGRVGSTFDVFRWITELP